MFYNAVEIFVMQYDKNMIRFWLIQTPKDKAKVLWWKLVSDLRDTRIYTKNIHLVLSAIKDTSSFFYYEDDSDSF